jgi:tetratricopeptide (TPR) repeat protein
MLQESTQNSRGGINISAIQKILFKALLFLLPLTIFPFPWDWTERGMSLLILSVSTIILGLEVIKLLWGGSLSILKSVLDIGFFLILLSYLLSTIFSVDINSSLWGIDGRLGSGLIVFIVILLVSIVSRGFIKGEKDVRSLLFFLLTGFFINNILSLFSFLGLNIWNFVPIYRDLYQAGLPLLRFGGAHILANFVSIILSIGLIGEYLIAQRGRLEYILSIIFGLFSAINIWLFSINEGLLSVSVILLLLIALLIPVLKSIKTDKETSRQVFLLSLITVFIVIIPVIFLQIPKVREALFPEDLEVVAELSLGFDLSWIISGSVIVSGFLQGFLGYGPGTYSIAYNRFKPLDTSILVLRDATFHTGVSEVFTKITTGGLLWLFIWLFVGFLIVRAFILDLRDAREINDKGGAWRFLIVDVSLLVLYVASFFFPFTILIIFLLLTLVSIRSIIREYLQRSLGDKFILKFWAVNLDTPSNANKSLYNFNIFLTVIVAAISVSLLGVWFARTVSSFHVLRAEAYSVRENRRYQENPETEVTLEDRERFILTMDDYYSKALNLDKKNSLYNRKKTLILLEELSIVIEAYSEIDEEETEQRDQYIEAIMALKGNTVDFARKTTEISPAVYSNWLARSTVYTGLLGAGFNEYVSDATNSLERAILLNPLSYELYYTLAQVHLVDGDQDTALQYLSRVLEINPRHIPSILLVADLSKEAEDMETYVAYLQAAKLILEQEEATSLDLYDQIVTALDGVDVEEVNLPEDLDLEESEGEEGLEGLEDEGIEQEETLEPGLGDF